MRRVATICGSQGLIVALHQTYSLTSATPFPRTLTTNACCHSHHAILSVNRYCSTTSKHTSSGVTEEEQQGELQRFDAAQKREQSDDGDDGHHHALSEEVAQSTEEPDGEAFDSLEAASQELHDVTYAMIAYLRRVATHEDPQVLTHRRMPRRMNRETVPAHLRRTMRGPSSEHAGFTTQKQLNEATQLFLQLGEKLMLLLTKETVDRMLKTTKEMSEKRSRREGIYFLKNEVHRRRLARYPGVYYKHAPFELQQLRSDMPQEAVQTARVLRDRSTLMKVMTLMEVKHAFRQQIESRMWEITGEYDPLTRQKTTEGESQKQQ